MANEGYLLDNQQAEAGQRSTRSRPCSTNRRSGTLMAERGVDLAYGRTLPRLLRGAGLVDVQSDAFFPMGGPACNDLERAPVEQVRDRPMAAGLATDAEVERHLANVASGRLDLATSPMVSAWGRKPAPQPS